MTSQPNNDEQTEPTPDTQDDSDQTSPEESNGQEQPMQLPVRFPLPMVTDWSQEIDILYTNLAPVLCDGPDKCQLLVLRLTLRDGSRYLVSGHGQRVAKLPDGRTHILSMNFIGQDDEDHNVAISVRPQDIFKVELVDMPDPDSHPPFGFAKRMDDQVEAVEFEQTLWGAMKCEPEA